VVKKMGMALLAALPISAGELVTLVNGHQMRAERVEIHGGTARLILGAGALEMPRTAIETIETFADAAAPVVVQAKPAATPVAPAPVAAEPAPTPRNAEDLIREAADRYGLPPALVRSLARAESNFRQDAISPKGAIGIMQLMPETAARLEADPANMEQNVDAGTRYLRDLLVRYDGSAYKALAAYNAGEKAVDRYNGIPPYEETQTYVRRVLQGYFRTTSATE
jgi:soluble lytic murein transglycosylase-like protein